MGKTKIKHIIKLLVLTFVMSCASTQPKVIDIYSGLKAQLRLLQLQQDFELKKDTIGFSEFKNSKFYAINGDIIIDIINVSNVHLIDFNNDGLEDIVYQSKNPYSATALYVNNGKDFIEIWNGPGKPVCIIQAENTTISVYSNYVGCMEINLLFEVTVSAENEITENLLSYHHNTQFTKLDADFKQKVVTGILRSTPIEDNRVTKDPCTGEQKHGNQIREIENQKVTVLKNKSDWLLVVYKNGNNSIITWIRNK